MTRLQPTLSAGLAWYVGHQTQDNDVVDAPEDTYLCELPVPIAALARYAARLGLLRWQDRDYTVAFFVDPDTKNVYACPHSDFVDARLPDRDIRAARQILTFIDARAFIREAYRNRAETSKGQTDENLRHEWDEWMAWRCRELPPPSVTIPRDPWIAYAAAGWCGFRDWLLIPPWPRTSTEQMAAVRELILQSARTWTTQRVERAFKGAKAAVIAERLADLAAAGLITRASAADDDQWRALRSSEQVHQEV